MKIRNPWPHYSMSRVTSKTPKGEVVSVASTRGDLEVPDDATEALIEPVKNGRPGAPAIAQGRIWSPEWGIQGIEDHLKKQQIVEGLKALEVKQKADCDRRAREADKRAKKTEKKPELLGRVVESVPSGVERAEKAEKDEKKAEKKAEKDEKTSK